MWQELVDIAPFRWSDILMAVVCGAIVGLERQLRGKPVGIRTSALVVLGTYFFVASALSVTTENSDPSRIIGQVVTGVGFLGAGVMMSRDGVVIGVTSAAAIWALASIGVVISLHHDYTALKLSLVVVAVLTGVDMLEASFQSLRRGVHQRYQSWRQRLPKEPWEGQ
ncbi:MgtC/SapB family protein [Gallaecimonas xiamenensis]|uniref:Protein MgtC n=1 Tax=Gallaecimonas xiamenensis 3-C-1 TaxID=745411 RepID=K2J1C1_9GAMM|nr:MgtC/SapB family protein [Gallaecimonas xiamenensis]EKE76726.1 MgtC/SapB transporter [Gallaecimonas xiamenensis 3-C-1]